MRRWRSERARLRRKVRGHRKDKAAAEPGQDSIVRRRTNRHRRCRTTDDALRGDGLGRTLAIRAGQRANILAQGNHDEKVAFGSGHGSLISIATTCSIAHCRASASSA